VGTFLAFDLGTVKIGYATCDSNSFVATPIQTVPSESDILLQVTTIVASYSPDIVVVGVPRRLNGQYSDKSQEHLKLIDLLNNKGDIRYVAQDETLSSVKASESYTKKQIDQHGLDACSAAVILEDYILAQKEKQQL
jgi:putative holliday junction resolvase